MSQTEKKSIAVLCSGGDGPGMNAALRSVVRSAFKSGVDVYGVYKGYEGLLERSVVPLDLASVGNIIQRGGTFIYTSRSPRFMEASHRAKAAEYLKELGVMGLVVIGGNGSFNGAHLLHTEHKIPVACIPGTIDNDIQGTEFTIGFDTATNTAVEAIDKIRDTATSHERTFLVEVMGRSAGGIAITVAITTGAEAVIFPDRSVDLANVATAVTRGVARGKKSSIIIVAEGEKEGLGHDYQKILKDQYQLDTRLCILGHIQRGGNPSARDRFLGSIMGSMAVKALLDGEQAVATVVRAGQFQIAPLSECLKKRNEFDTSLLELLNTLAL
ncbi:MAG: 6-phosphofructokinase [Proteobacteria bacterium]|nr:MAG: 6-phosphofructokinase [Pseudomonadota bacterium]